MLAARLIDLVGVESADSAIEVKDSQMKPETPNASHATPHFWHKMQLKTLQARQVVTSRVGRFGAKKGSLHSPRGRLVASLVVLWYLKLLTL